MTLTPNYLGTLGYLIWLVISIYIWLVIIRVLLTWFSASLESPAGILLAKITDPALSFIRTIFPFTLGGIDFSPVILILVLNFLANYLRFSLQYLGVGYSGMVLIPLFLICLVQILISLYWLILILMAIRVVLSLVRPDPYNPLVLIVYGATEPLLSPLRQYFPKGPGGLDIKALVFIAFLVLFYVFILNNIMLKSIAWVTLYGPKVVR